jgi:ferredoxin
MVGVWETDLRLKDKTLLVCDCNGTMPLDGIALTKMCVAAGATGKLDINTLLCRTQLGNFETAVTGDTPVIVACTQEAPLFTEVRAEDGVDTDLRFVNIREHAGWSAEGALAMPKIAALLAEAALDVPGPPAITLKSSGVTLVYGRDDVAIDAARQIADRLDCTVLLNKPGDIVPPRMADVPIFIGSIAAAKGHLGAFEVVVNGYAPSLPSSRSVLQFEAPRDGASSTCDLILDLTGGTPMFPAHEKRDGYFRADPKDPAAVQRVLFELVETVGEFEKPLYVAYNQSLCAHSRNKKTGCTRCLDVCPTDAIKPSGDYVEIDAYVCAGCGSCASVCPTGAASYAMPSRDLLLERLRIVLSTYAKSGGTAPAILVHDGPHGEEILAAMARHGRGLPARVIPFRVNSVTQVGFDFFSVALAYGASQVRLLVDPRHRDELAGLATQIGLAETALSGLGYGTNRVSVLDDVDPDAVEATLYGDPVLMPPKAGSFLPMGTKRGITMLALRQLHETAPQPVDILPLAPGSPFGTLDVNAEGCTLCLSCVSVCPTGALIDNPDQPMLRFIEEACVQCGLCKATCPEKVIQLRPQLNFTAEAKSPALIKEEEPALCIRCSKPFGTKGTIEKVIQKLAGRSTMYQDPAIVDRMRMCADCRLIAQTENAIDPFAGPSRPVPRTTEDYVREREIEEARASFKAAQGPGGPPPKLDS